MESSKKEEAVRAKQIALEMMENKDFLGAWKYSIRAHQLCPDLENIAQMNLVCEVHCSAAERVCEDEKNWYKILKIDPTADGASVRRQYNKLALSLHPDKNRFPGAADAFRLIREGRTVLADSDKRRLFDSRWRGQAMGEWGNYGFERFWDQSWPNVRGSKRGRPKGSRKRKMGSSGDGNVGGDGDDEVEIIGTVKRSRKSRGKERERHTASGDDANGINPGKSCQVPGDGNVGDDANDMAGKVDDEVDIVGMVKSSRKGGRKSSGKERERHSASGDDANGINPGKTCQVPGDGNVGDDANDIDEEEVEIVHTVKRSKRGRKSSIFAAVEVDPIASKPRENACNVMNPGKTCQVPGNSPSGLGTKSVEYPDAEFNDFEKDRAKEWFKPGQIWACYDTIDGMPRFYALINKVISGDFRLHITWLEPFPDHNKEIRWLNEGLPASCGKFRLGESDTIGDHAMVSHLVNWKKGINLRDIYQIYPRKGETWALFKNWDIDQGREKKYEFEFVEVLTDYCCDGGVSIAFLGRIEGFGSLFSRKGMDCEVIPVRDRLRFSHRIPSFPMTRNEGLIGSSSSTNCFELDTASLPTNIQHFDKCFVFDV